MSRRPWNATPIASTRARFEYNGRGFDREAALGCARHGSGLAAVRYRLKLVGGEMEVDTRPGDGTRITLIAPLYLEAGVEAA